MDRIHDFDVMDIGPAGGAHLHLAERFGRKVIDGLIANASVDGDALWPFSQETTILIGLIVLPYAAFALGFYCGRL